MLFHEQSFLFIFLPVALFGIFIMNRFIPRFAVWWIVICSFAFYSFHGLQHLPLLLISISINYFLGLVIEKNRFPNCSGSLLIVGIIINLAILAFFKYGDFILCNLSYFEMTPSQKTNIILPLAISFFTFQQIAYLIDLKKGEIR